MARKPIPEITYGGSTGNHLKKFGRDARALSKGNKELHSVTTLWQILDALLDIKELRKQTQRFNG